MRIRSPEIKYCFIAQKKKTYPVDRMCQLLGVKRSGYYRWAKKMDDSADPTHSDILIACVDGLKGFPEAIESIYPKTEIQHCIIHQIRNSLKYVASKNQKAFMADLKCVYKATTLNAAESALDELETKWDDYPTYFNELRIWWIMQCCISVFG